MDTNNYSIYLNYDNDRQVYIIPVNPEEIQISSKGDATSVSIDQFGEVLHKGKRGASVVKFDSFFPPSYDPYVCSCRREDFKSPDEWNRWIKSLEEAEKPCHLVLTNSPLGLNIYADITSYVPREVGGDPGTIYYSIELKEHREPVVRTVKNIDGNISKSSKNSRVNNSGSSNKYKITAKSTKLRKGPNAKVIATIKKGKIVTSDGKKNGGWIHVFHKNKWGYVHKSYMKEC